jgi:Uma2 family endonuclease
VYIASVNPGKDIPREKLRPLRRSEYDQLVRLGAFQHEHIELLYGQLVQRCPQSGTHSEVLRRLTMLLTPTLVGRALVQILLPIAASDESEPQPDVAIVPPGTYAPDHPSHALLVIEVADSSLRYDREVKSKLYAAAGIPEYWIVDLQHRRVEVYRDPLDGVYTRLTPFTEHDRLRPAAFPDIELHVADLLPPA